MTCADRVRGAAGTGKHDKATKPPPKPLVLDRKMYAKGVPGDTADVMAHLEIGILPEAKLVVMTQKQYDDTRDTVQIVDLDAKITVILDDYTKADS